MDGIDLKREVQARYSEVAEGAECCGSLCGFTENAEGLALAFSYAKAAGKMVEVPGQAIPGVENLLSVNLSAVK